MPQFGAGTQLAAQCPRPDAPDGYRLWDPDWDGPVPDALAQRARAMATDASTPMGAMESFPLPGVVALIRVETHVWGPDASGKLVAGCFRTAGAYLPVEKTTLVQPLTRESPWAKAAAILTVFTVGAGIIATLTSWASSKSRSPTAVARSPVSARARSGSLRSASGPRRSRSRSRATRRVRRRAS